ncbi:molecular chaperone HtpG [Puniceicoccales bacterium CK1056]|uniref:Chaperone protein HtpG n=1 Tax=Oceanipulchritudo coccoides TaxID=2706888 RepID=A0A6B2M2E9_9BACT|nr:molecular chaperone HtpG [Oceanipulchritudo coccoides]NDV61975.1 molecular chaperone HtpG [Oceanipulchritudo coccoides]
MSTKKTETHTFQAETRQLLDIVIHSLYTDRDIFVRELVSNASDALEKLRHTQLTGESIYDEKLPLEVNISTDDTAGTITIQDYGIGMTHDELVENIGTIAKSGSKAFASALKEAKESGSDPLNLIGQFGVGFYSAFMVADEVRVYTHSYKEDGENLVWISDGMGEYRIEQTEDSQRRGSKIVVKLKEDAKEFAQKSKIEEIIKRYSSFVQFPINLNGDRVNTIEALWLKNKNEIKPEEYTEFYKFQANAFDEPRHTLHFSADAPLLINALLFSPKENIERFGFGRTEPGVSLYCKKVLIDDKPEGLLPEWLRFLRGVVDSADLPLNISRESMQDSALVQKLNKILTGRFLKHLATEADKNPDAYTEFYDQFGIYLKEGITTDFTHKDKLAKLLRYESSLSEPGKRTSLADYVSRMKEEQKEIYFLYAPSRDSIESGPYLEAFTARNLEVIFLYEPIDEFVMNHLNEFEGKKLVAADSADVSLEDTDSSPEHKLTEDEQKDLSKWLKETLGDKVTDVVVSKRLVDSPAAALNSDKMMTPSMRRIMKAMNQDAGGPNAVQLEINPSHALMQKLHGLKEGNPEIATLVAEQIYDNSMIAAGFVEDPRSMVKRIYDLLEKL